MCECVFQSNCVSQPCLGRGRGGRSVEQLAEPLPDGRLRPLHHTVDDLLAASENNPSHQPAASQQADSSGRVMSQQRASRESDFQGAREPERGRFVVRRTIWQVGTSSINPMPWPALQIPASASPSASAFRPRAPDISSAMSSYRISPCGAQQLLRALARRRQGEGGKGLSVRHLAHVLALILDNLLGHIVLEHTGGVPQWPERQCGVSFVGLDQLQQPQNPRSVNQNQHGQHQAAASTRQHQ